MEKDIKNSHAFIQVLQGKQAIYDYIKYKVTEFSVNNDDFHIGINKNLFSFSEMNLDLLIGNTRIKGSLKFNKVKKWPDSFLNPGSMGFYNYFSFMECYSQVCAVDGVIDGVLQVGEKSIDFTGGKVYIEKNWGKAFPKSWIWIQSNSFNDNDVSLTCSIGRVPFVFGSFEGFLVGLYVKDKFYSFTTINRSKMRINKIGNDVEIIFRRKNLELMVKTYSEENKFMLCKGPRDGEMIPLVNENLKGKVFLELRDTKRSEVLFSGTGENTGIEYGGEELRTINSKYV